MAGSGLVDATTSLPSAWAAPVGIQPGDPFTLQAIGIASGALITVRSLFVRECRWDDIGVILDDVAFPDETTGVPEPASLAPGNRLSCQAERTDSYQCLPDLA